MDPRDLIRGSENQGKKFSSIIDRLTIVIGEIFVYNLHP
jgi:hypothetical protein